MSVNLITVFLGISILFCVQENNIRYTTDYNDSENLINVSTDIEYSGLPEKFNQQYFISPTQLCLITSLCLSKPYLHTGHVGSVFLL